MLLIRPFFFVLFSIPPPPYSCVCFRTVASSPAIGGMETFVVAFPLAVQGETSPPSDESRLAALAAAILKGLA